MKVLAIVIAGLAAVSAQSMSGLPPCAVACLTSGLTTSGCPPGDISCACKSTPFIAGASSCIGSSCIPEDQKKAITGATALCKSVGVDITPPAPSSSVLVPTGSVPSPSVSLNRSTTPTATFAPAPTYGGGNNLTNITSAGPSAPTNKPGPNSAGRLSVAVGLVGVSFAAMMFGL